MKLFYNFKKRKWLLSSIFCQAMGFYNTEVIIEMNRLMTKTDVTKVKLPFKLNSINLAVYDEIIFP